MRLDQPIESYTAEGLQALVLRKAHLEKNWTSKKPSLQKRRTIRDRPYYDILLVPGGRWLLMIHRLPKGAISAFDLDSNTMKEQQLIGPLSDSVPPGEWVDPQILCASVDETSPNFAFDLAIAYEYSGGEKTLPYQKSFSHLKPLQSRTSQYRCGGSNLMTMASSQLITSSPWSSSSRSAYLEGIRSPRTACFK